MAEPESESDLITTLTDLRKSVSGLAAVVGQSFPLDKRETFAALIIMGLSSRLQPLHVTNNKESAAAQASIINLGFKLADMAVAESDKKEDT